MAGSKLHLSFGVCTYCYLTAIIYDVHSIVDALGLRWSVLVSFLFICAAALLCCHPLSIKSFS